MGMLAEYMAVESNIVDQLMELNNEDLADAIYELEEAGKSDSIGLDKLWDALHYFLTGVSASEPIEGNKLSEAVVGVHNFSDDEDADFISCIEDDEIEKIISALEAFRPEENKDRLDKSIMKKIDLYPKGIGWANENENLYESLVFEIGQLTAFYKKALKENKCVIVSIL